MAASYEQLRHYTHPVAVDPALYAPNSYDAAAASGSGGEYQPISDEELIHEYAQPYTTTIHHFLVERSPDPWFTKCIPIPESIASAGEGWFSTNHVDMVRTAAKKLMAKFKYPSDELFIRSTDLSYVVGSKEPQTQCYFVSVRPGNEFIYRDTFRCAAGGDEPSMDVLCKRINDDVIKSRKDYPSYWRARFAELRGDKEFAMGVIPEENYSEALGHYYALRVGAIHTTPVVSSFAADLSSGSGGDQQSTDQVAAAMQQGPPRVFAAPAPPPQAQYAPQYAPQAQYAPQYAPQAQYAPLPQAQYAPQYATPYGV